MGISQRIMVMGQ